MEKLKNFEQKHIYIFTSSLIALVFMIYIFTHVIFAGKVSSMTNLMDFLVYLLPITITYALLGIMQIYGKAGFQIKGFGKGIWLGSYLLFACVCIFISSYPSGNKEITMPQFSSVIIFALNCIGVGVFEEGLFRGIILNNMIRKWGRTKRGVYKAAIISSVFFGMTHIVNLLVKPDYLVGTIAEILYSCFFGLMLAAIYIRSQCMFSNMFFHILVTVCTSYPLLFTVKDAVVGTVDMTITDAGMMVGVCATYVPVALFLLRKVKACSCVNELNCKENID